MRPSPTTIRAGIAARPRQPGHGHETNRLQALLPPGCQRHETTIALSNEIADQSLESSGQVRNGIDRDRIDRNRANRNLGLDRNLAAGAPAGSIQHFHRINTKQPL